MFFFFCFLAGIYYTALSNQLQTPSAAWVLKCQHAIFKKKKLYGKYYDALDQVLFEILLYNEGESHERK